MSTVFRSEGNTNENVEVGGGSLKLLYTADGKLTRYINRRSLVCWFSVWVRFIVSSHTKFVIYPLPPLSLYSLSESYPLSSEWNLYDAGIDSSMFLHYRVFIFKELYPKVHGNGVKMYSIQILKNRFLVHLRELTGMI